MASALAPTRLTSSAICSVVAFSPWPSSAPKWTAPAKGTSPGSLSASARQESRSSGWTTAANTPWPSAIGFASLGRSAALRRLAALRRRVATRQHHRLVPRSQFVRQLCGQPTLVGSQDPDPRRLAHLGGPAGHDHALVEDPGRVRLVHPQHLDRVEAGVAECAAPDGRTRQCVVRAVVVGEAPPAVQLPEGQIHPAETAQVLECDQLARRRHEFRAMRERFFQIAGRVKDVGRDDQVVAMRVEALLDRGPSRCRADGIRCTRPRRRTAPPPRRRSRRRCRCTRSRTGPPGAPATPKRWPTPSPRRPRSRAGGGPWAVRRQGPGPPLRACGSRRVPPAL